MIIRCASVAGVVTAVRTARELDLARLAWQSTAVALFDDLAAGRDQLRATGWVFRDRRPAGTTAKPGPDGTAS